MARFVTSLNGHTVSTLPYLQEEHVEPNSHPTRIAHPPSCSDEVGLLKSTRGPNIGFEAGGGKYHKYTSRLPHVTNNFALSVLNITNVVF